jgi:hypothetical protein
MWERGQGQELGVFITKQHKDPQCDGIVCVAVMVGE